MKLARILIIEDEAHIRDMIKFALANANFATDEAENTRQAEHLIADAIPDLILLDWMLPGESGVEFAKRLKKHALAKDVPIIMLTAKAEEESKIKGLAVADDYVTKPFSPRELIARIQSVLRRGMLVSPEGIIQIKELTVNTHNHSVTIANKPVHLTPNEYQLLKFFITHQNRAYSREQLLTQIWGGNVYIDERTVDVQIKRLRKKLATSDCKQWIQTVRGLGYKFSVTSHH